MGRLGHTYQPASPCGRSSSLETGRAASPGLSLAGTGAADPARHAPPPPVHRQRLSPGRPPQALLCHVCSQALRTWDLSLGHRRSPRWPLWIDRGPSAVCRRKAPDAGFSRCPDTRPPCRTRRTGKETPVSPAAGLGVRGACGAARSPGQSEARRDSTLPLLYLSSPPGSA